MPSAFMVSKSRSMKARLCSKFPPNQSAPQVPGRRPK